ncbi:hypothetical protein [Paenibacillus sinopodophylli]|uniref:hypothetical protein n=1 Tax=Paenibacillus sinopodophylli TaxID=1837342 RepID=UPI00110CD8F6|nr:hypothetical protein [Paenibacillus sinopodophylli]
MNQQYLLKKWIPIMIVMSIMVVALFISLGNGNYSVLVSVAVAVVIIIMIRRRASDKVGIALKQRTSEQLIVCLTKPLQSLKDKEIIETFVACNTALSHILYGEYERAETVIGQVNWDRKIPMYQAIYWNIKTLIKYFHTHEYTEGLSLARKAKALATVSHAYPGSKKSNMAYEAYVEIGQVLVGMGSEHSVTSLELKFDKLPLLVQLFVANGLCVAYKQSGQADKFAKMDAFIKQNAPFCKALQDYSA